MEEMFNGSFYKNTLKMIDEAGKVAKVDPNIMVRLRSPRRVISVSVPVRMDDYSVKVFHGYRVQHNSTLGPFKGGIRYHELVNVSEVGALACLMSFKNSLLNLPLGGAKGGVKVDSTKLSKTEKQNLTRRYTTEISPFIGPTKDIPAPDVGTDAQTMAWMMDTYSQEYGFAQPGVVTGKPIEIGGSVGRESATGRGVIYASIEALKKRNKDIKNATFAIQGFGKVGLFAAETAYEMGAKIVAVSDVSGAIQNGDGLNIPEVIEYLKEHKVLKAYPNAESLSNEELLQLDVDVLCPCALEGVINSDNAESVRAGIIVEGANGPLTKNASEFLTESKNTLIVPDILANGGGVIVSYFEWVQDITALFWDEDEVDRRLRKLMNQAFDKAWDYAEEADVSMRTASLAVAVKRLEKAMLLRGLYPR